jgi:hypothetical protein
LGNWEGAIAETASFVMGKAIYLPSILEIFDILSLVRQAACEAFKMRE